MVVGLKNPGFSGCGSTEVLLASMSTTSCIVGLSSGDSCTHSSPTCMHLRTSEN
ncbi:unnamed protein product [Spirodela intermedia]|uniref:Uncharacterized protein n=2 Tax=Spirodela intermedia TaxID=51605 RepID=A0A7I8KBQ0_SPIIN|nr:unnamed protein product [Spirodela intermedia]CAA6658368.1 unnamed protein product [Spirodela intermedia]CAA7394624.1 unnamed protein product [Spirodela intermedia]